MSVFYSSVNQQQQDRKRGPGAHKPISGAANNGVGLIRITCTGHGFSTGNKVDVTGVIGTTEANGVGWTITSIDANHFDLQSSTFANTYSTGGMASLQ